MASKEWINHSVERLGVRNRASVTLESATFYPKRALSSTKFFKSGFKKESTTQIKDVSVFLKENSKGEKTEYAYVVTFQTGQVSHLCHQYPSPFYKTLGDMGSIYQTHSKRK